MRMSYGDALSTEVRSEGSVAVMSSGGVTGSHDTANTLSPCIVVGRKGSHGSIHWTDDPAFVIDTAYYIDRRHTAVDLRWLYYVLLSRDLRGLSQDVGVPGLSREAAYNAAGPTPPDIEEQRRIAGFLDVETARLDGLLELRGRQMRALAEKKSLLFEAAVARYGVALPATLVPGPDAWRLPDGWLVTSLSRVLDRLTNGYVGPTRDILENDGVRYIQGLHIKGGDIDFERRPFFVSAAWHRDRPRINLRRGDVLIVQTGDIGQVAVVPPDFGEASCHALLIARVRKGLLTGEYLGAYLRSHFGYRSLLSRATGALHPHLEGGIRDVPVLVPPLWLQSPLVDEIAAGRSKIKGLEARVQRQVELLSERRVALITAAVTGQVDVTTASGAA